MAQEFGKLEVTDPDAEAVAADGGVELTLRLSIGGSGRDLLRSVSAGVTRESNADLCGGDLNLAGRYFFTGGEDPQQRRESHAIRRQDAQRNWEEIRRGLGGVTPWCGDPARTCSVEDRKVLEAQGLKSRARDREARENEERGDDRWPFKPDQHSFPVMPMQYPYQQVQYVSAVNAFGVPCMIPCWAPAISSAADGSKRPERTEHQPAPPLQFPAPALQFKGCHLDLNGGKGIGIEPIPSLMDSLGCSSSSISVHRSGALHGESSSSGSEAKSQSGPALAEKPQPQTTPSSQVSNPQWPSGEGISCYRRKSSSQSPSPTTRKLEGATSVNKPISTAGDPVKTDDSSPSSLPRMPCVATTGNGPNGKTVTGLLYRYNTESEVCIVCVCHGTSFSPAEFVRHAGSTDVSHPLRQIVVVPS